MSRLFEGRRLPRAVTGLLVATALPLASCGGSSSASVQGVRHTMHAFVYDVLGGNYSGACALLTPAARAPLGGSEPKCTFDLTFAMSAVNSEVQKTMRREARKIDHWPVSVHGNTATVHNANGSTTQFVKQGGRWLIGRGGLTGR